MRGIAQRVKDGGHLHAHLVAHADDVALRDGKVFCKAAGAVHADTLRVRAEMEKTFAAVAAVSADDMTFSGYDFARAELRYGRPHFLNDTAVFMPHVHADGDGLLCPCIPVPDVQVGPADGGLVNFNQYIVRPNFGHRYVQQLQAFIGLCLHQCFHGRYDILLSGG